MAENKKINAEIKKLTTDKHMWSINKQYKKKTLCKIHHPIKTAKNAEFWILYNLLITRTLVTRFWNFAKKIVVKEVKDSRKVNSREKGFYNQAYKVVNIKKLRSEDGIDGLYSLYKGMVEKNKKELSTIYRQDFDDLTHWNFIFN